jgi:hypothetical protein
MVFMHKSIKEYKDFAVLILSHGRANKVMTYKSLKKQNYTGKIYVVIDDEDKTIDEYKKKFKDEVIIFNKQEAIDMTDSADALKKRNSVVYARNYAYRIAEQLSLKYFLVLDDDYEVFSNTFNNNRNYVTKNTRIRNLDNYMCAMIRFLKHSNIDCIAMSQCGDYIGGDNATISILHSQGKMLRKTMNAFFLRTDRPLRFSGRINEDVNMYITEGSLGRVMFTYPRMRLKQLQTQSNSGGLTDIYLDLGTYVKSFYSILFRPSCVKLMMMGVKHKRIHHKVLWKHAVPMILSEAYKK